MGGSFRIARLAGIDIEIHPTWLLVLGFLAWTLSDATFPSQYENWSETAYWIVGVSAALLLFVTVLVHELAHAFVAKRRGLDVPKITLFIFGGISHMARQPRSAGEEFQIAVAGPVTSLAIAAVTGLAGLLAGSSEKAEGILLYLAAVNVLLAVFNILPGFPLDGGRVFRSIAWRRTGSFRKATRLASRVGEGFGYLLIIGGVALALGGLLINGIWFGFIGWFLLSAARAEAQNLQLESILGRLKARDVMHPEFVTVTPGLSIQELVDKYLLEHGERAAVVANDGAVLGIVTVTDVKQMPREKWANTPVQQVMTPRERVATVEADARAVDVMQLLAERRLNQVPVLENGRMVGLISRRELLDRVHLAEQLGTREGEGKSTS